MCGGAEEPFFTKLALIGAFGQIAMRLTRVETSGTREGDVMFHNEVSSNQLPVARYSQLTED
jgi:hypothetical protein